MCLCVCVGDVCVCVWERKEKDEKEDGQRESGGRGRGRGRTVHCESNILDRECRRHCTWTVPSPSLASDLSSSPGHLPISLLEFPKVSLAVYCAGKYDAPLLDGCAGNVNSLKLASSEGEIANVRLTVSMISWIYRGAPQLRRQDRLD